jgi:endonuclease/exonuclease/phosphatase family metal-dependent hydrolase
MGTGPIVALALISVAAVLAIVAVLAPSGAAHGSRSYLQFNLCGHACSGGELAVATDLANTIEERMPFVVTLNEVCENQYDQLRTDLAAYDGQFDPTGPRCRNGARYGNAVLLRATGLDVVGSWQLPNPAGDETRRLLCVRSHMIVCVTHISNEAGNIAAQVGAVADIISGLDLNYPLLLGGDFNTNPDDPRLDPLYRTCEGGGGRFHEADSAGCANRSVLNGRVGSDVINEDTYGRHKYDYIFLSAGDWPESTADAIEATNRLSDHDALWATTPNAAVHR